MAWFVPGTFILATIVVVVGFAVVIGLSISGMSRFMRSSRAYESMLGPAEVRLLVQSMAAMATADGAIAPAEIDAFARIYAQTTGLTIAPGDIRDILKDFGPEFDIAARLRRERVNLSPQYRKLLVKNCEQVMTSDDITSAPEAKKLSAIREALGLPAETVD